METTVLWICQSCEFFLLSLTSFCHPLFHWLISKGNNTFHVNVLYDKPSDNQNYFPIKTFQIVVGLNSIFCWLSTLCPFSLTRRPDPLDQLGHWCMVFCPCLHTFSHCRTILAYTSHWVCRKWCDTKTGILLTKGLFCHFPTPGRQGQKSPRGWGFLSYRGQAEADTEMTLSASPTTAVGQKALFHGTSFQTLKPNPNDLLTWKNIFPLRVICMILPNLHPVSSEY